MNTSTKRAASVGVSLAAVGAIVVGSVAFAATVNAEPAPRPASVVSVDREPEPFVAPITAEDEAIAEAAREAARIEAERLAAEKAAAEAAAKKLAEEEAARAAAEEAARQSQSRTSTGGGGTGTAPQQAPVSPPRSCAPGDVPMEVDGAGNAVSCLPGGCLNGTVDSSRPECQTPYRP